RVHITKPTLLQLGGRFEVEPGDGGSREGYLADHKVETYLIIPPKKPSGISENGRLSVCTVDRKASIVSSIYNDISPTKGQNNISPAPSQHSFNDDSRVMRSESIRTDQRSDSLRNDSIRTNDVMRSESVRTPDVIRSDSTYIYSTVITLASISVFLRVGFVLKFVVMCFTLTVHIIMFASSDIFNLYENRGSEEHFTSIPYAAKAGLILVFLAALLHILDRQIEFTSRTDFLWKDKLKFEQEEILLENILPAHVAEHFLTSVASEEDLYHERYSSIAVMFASIPNYKEFYDETDLLLKPKFSCIEKIKTIGSTYMIASGLCPGKEEGKKIDAKSKEEHTVAILVEFAMALMSILDQINRESFQRFKLRIGLACVV
ncbi:Adenylyl cyclase 76E, partial [Operophtera brumata]